jgi:hypothetical protein
MKLLNVNTKNHHSFDIKGGIVYVKIIGDGDTQSAKQFIKDAEDIFGQYPDQKFNAIVDMLESGYSDYGGMKIYRDFIKDERILKLAFVLKDKVVETLVKIVTDERKSPTAFFKTIGEAEIWIKNN